MKDEVIVVGSGPSGTHCALALLRRGISVLMIDPGLMLEPEKQNYLAGLLPTDVNNQILLKKLYRSLKTNKKIPKLSFGSDFAYRSADTSLTIHEKKVSCLFSNAQAGLSNVWGATLLPYHANDINDWPFSENFLANYYPRIIENVSLLAQEDALAKIFPLFSSQFFRPTVSQQAQYILATTTQRSIELENHHIWVGKSRLAMKASSCIHCGQCLKGCPLDLIYSSKQTLQLLHTHKNFRYESGWFVNKIKENKQAVHLDCYNTYLHEKRSFHGSKVFLATGPLMTAKLILNSFPSFNNSLILKDSQHFIIPALLKTRVKNTTNERVFTLSQLFLEIMNPMISNYSSHLQIYTYSDLYEKKLKFLKAFPPILKNILLDRLIVIQGYLHSKDSSSIHVKYHSEKNHLNLSSIAQERTLPIIKKILHLLRMESEKLGFNVLPYLTKISKPGVGNHLGGSFPMSNSAKPGTTDLNGLLSGTERVHVVDSSVFPSLPAQSPTLSIMANAYRIGTECSI